MPWVTDAAHARPLVTLRRPNNASEHDTQYQTHTHILPLTSLPFAVATEPPDLALRMRLHGQPAAITTLLFAPLGSFAEASAAGRVDDRLAAVLRLVQDGSVHAPHAWSPHIVEPDGSNVIGRQVYTALCLRVNILESYCQAMRTEARRTAMSTNNNNNNNNTTGSRGSTSSSTGSTASGSRSKRARHNNPLFASATLLDGCSHYAHLWLDAHLLLCCAIEAAGMCPRDGTAELAAFLAAYEPSAATCFHEGELPDLLRHVEACSFFGEATATAAGTSSYTYLFSKAVPHRCVVRDVIQIIETQWQQNMHFFQAIIAASLLGVYRHVRVRPPFDQRLRLYRYFFFCPPADVARVIDQCRRNRGVATSFVDDISREFAWAVPAPGGNDDDKQHSSGGTVGILTQRRQAALHAWLSSTMTGAEKKRYTHQDTVISVVREYLVHALSWLPHVHDELCSRTAWRAWELSVIDGLDAMRGSPAPAGAGVLKDISPALLPTKTLYQVEKEPFVRAVARACGTFLDSGRRSAAGPDGSERPLDAPFPPQFAVLLRRMMAIYPASVFVRGFMPTTDVPDDEATAEQVEAEYVQAGRFPLRLLYGSRAVIREYRAAAAEYRKCPSPAIAQGLVRFLSEHSMYQLQLVHAFVQAIIDRGTMFAVPLPAHMARQQANVLRRRLNLIRDDGSVDEHSQLPRHMLTSFVCRICRKFRGTTTTTTTASKTQQQQQQQQQSLSLVTEVPPFGSELVSFAHTSIDDQADGMLRFGGRMPTWTELTDETRQSPTLLAWYQSHAGIDTDLRPYPPDPSIVTAGPGDIDRARTWHEQQQARLADVAFAPDTAVPRLPWTRPGAGAPDLFTVGVPKLLDTNATAAGSSIGGDAGAGAGALALVSEQGVLDRWTRMTGRRLMVGHASAVPDEPTVKWTCASKYYKHEERKTRQEAFSRQHVQDAITERQQVAAQRTANTKRRKDIRFYHHYSLCSQTRLLECNMLGWAVSVDGRTYVACCQCLAYVVVGSEACRWRGGLLLCRPCWQQTQTGAMLTLARLSSGTAVKCHQCKRVWQPHERPFRSTTVLADHMMRFVDIYLCDKHVTKKAWLFAAPNYQSLSTVDLGLKVRWTSLKRWDHGRDYLRLGPAPADAAALDRQLVNRVRRSIGASLIDGDGDDNAKDNDSGNEDQEADADADGEASESASETGAARGKGKGKRKRSTMPPPRMRPIGTARAHTASISRHRQ